MKEIGQSPIVVKKEIDSFILNRLQVKQLLILFTEIGSSFE